VACTSNVVLNVEADPDAGTDAGDWGSRGGPVCIDPFGRPYGWLVGGLAKPGTCLAQVSSTQRRRNGPYLEWKGRISVHLG